MTDPTRHPLMHVFVPGLDDDRCAHPGCGLPMRRHVLLSEFDDFLADIEAELWFAMEARR